MPVTNEVNVVGVRRSADSELLYVAGAAGGAIPVTLSSTSVAVTALPIPTNIDSHSGTGGDSFSSSLDFGAVIKTLFCLIESNGAIIQVSVDNSNWSDDIILPSGIFFGLDIAIRYIKIKNRTAGNNCTYALHGAK